MTAYELLTSYAHLFQIAIPILYMRHQSTLFHLLVYEKKSRNNTAYRTTTLKMQGATDMDLSVDLKLNKLAGSDMKLKKLLGKQIRLRDTQIHY